MNDNVASSDSIADVKHLSVAGPVSFSSLLHEKDALRISSATNGPKFPGTFAGSDTGVGGGARRSQLPHIASAGIQKFKAAANRVASSQQKTTSSSLACTIRTVPVRARAAPSFLHHGRQILCAAVFLSETLGIVSSGIESFTRHCSAASGYGEFGAVQDSGGEE